MKNRKFYTIIITLLVFIFSAVSFTSCVDDTDSQTKELYRYKQSDVKSYADLFDVFWTVMSQKYNYFNEQKGKSWQAVYNEYYPKFKELKTFSRDPSFSASEIEADYNLAKDYFTDIIDPILDVHFNVKITMPISHSYNRSSYYFGGMKNAAEEETLRYDFAIKKKYMDSKVDTATAISKSNLLGGYLKSNSDIYYFTFDSFMLSENYIIQFRNRYLPIDKESSYYVTEQKIRDAEALQAVTDPASKQVLISESIKCLDKFNSFMTSTLVQQALGSVDKFKSTEEITIEFIEQLMEIAQKAPVMNKELNNIASIPEFKSNPIYTKWFSTMMTNHLQLATEYTLFLSDMTALIANTSKLEFYLNFLNPLKRGEIKKIIIDLRGNGGGMVLDARNFTDRFITKDVIFAYQRFKEDNNPYSYTPWAPVRTVVSDRSIDKEIPIAVLIDKGSVSMSEMSTLMLRSQGDHVTVIGDYSAGGTAGLGDSDEFNGGTRETVAGYLTFYMPLLAMQDADRNVIEGIGIKPDHLLDPLTEEEVLEMAISPSTHIDRTLVKAIEVLKSE